jgi:hypothetical protein
VTSARGRRYNWGEIPRISVHDPGPPEPTPLSGELTTELEGLSDGAEPEG